MHKWKKQTASSTQGAGAVQVTSNVFRFLASGFFVAGLVFMGGCTKDLAARNVYEGLRN